MVTCGYIRLFMVTVGYICYSGLYVVAPGYVWLYLLGSIYGSNE